MAQYEISGLASKCGIKSVQYSAVSVMTVVHLLLSDRLYSTLLRVGPGK